MASNRILSSLAVNKLQVNRLDAQAIRSDNIRPFGPSNLHSIYFNNANFSRNSTGGTLTFTQTDIDSIIQFSDGAFREPNNIDFNTFVDLFYAIGDDSPNGLLVHQEEQRTYRIKLLISNADSGTITLDLLPNQSHNLGDVNVRMSLFVDSGTKQSSSGRPLIWLNNLYNCYLVQSTVRNLGSFASNVVFLFDDFYEVKPIPRPPT